MRISIDNIVVFERRFESWDDIHDAYVDRESAEGREIPDYLLESILVGVAIWMLQEAGSQLASWYAGRADRERTEDESAMREQRAEERHRELLAAIERLGGPDRDRISTGEFLRELNRSGQRIEVVPQTDADRDLIEALEQAIAGDDAAAPG